MKKTITLAAIVIAAFSNAQTWNLTGNTGTDPAVNFLGTSDAKDLIIKTGNKERIQINSLGNIGMGTAPDPKLTLNLLGNATFVASDPTLDGYHFFSAGQNNIKDSDLMWLSYNNHQTNDVGILTLSAPPTPGNWSQPVFSVRANGKVLIGVNWNNLAQTGCADCNNYKLFVRQGIKTEKVKVEVAAENGWADYVFEDNYKLMDLKTLENYIKENKHLPEVPTTAEAIKEGIELKEMNILLLKKIEELTLHVIDLNKKIETLQNSK
ncbi:hypothetical protein [Chryseobacterium sp. YR459]|jgi:hypothetical protein|uniref:hypothetical protein n=1 Tax=Chryseobacterium sp. HR92 TaxID=3094839 RepID=UPI000689B3D7|nr:hypothetical protein SFA27_05530 [Chryseobacterium sp. HR92]